MIRIPPGWTAEPRADHYILRTSGTDSEAGAIRYYERLRPLRRMGDVVAGRLRAAADFLVTHTGPLVELITEEGEFAALVILDGQWRGHRAQRAFGVTFGDDFYALTESVCIASSQFERFGAVVRELILGDAHGIYERRRRFRYTPPLTWQPLVRGLETDWIPHDFPNEWAMLTVFPADPLRQGPPRRRQPLDVADELGRETISTGTLTGDVVWSTGMRQQRQTLRAVVNLSDGRYQYCMELLSMTPEAWPQHRDCLAGCWQSITPLPAARMVESAGAMILSLYNDD